MTAYNHNAIQTSQIHGLYLITDDSPAEQLISRVGAALRGGARIVQYRDKVRSADNKLKLAISLRQLCRDHQALFIINDSIELARASQADGVHLGQQDGTVAEARKQLGPQSIIGVSTRTEQMARQAQSDGADYIGVGSVFPTGTKQDAVHIGLDGLQRIRQAVSLPIVAIGGITSDRLSQVIDTGADAAALVSAVMADPQPATAARELALQFNRHQPLPHGRVLTIAGSDSGGGAGIQADLKTATLLGSYASSVITALTAQNTHGVTAIHAPPASFVRQQLDAVLSDIGCDVIKTGMLYSAEIIATIADALTDEAALCVIDPVMIAKGGSSLLQQQAIDTFTQRLLPKAYLLTPNVPEAEALTGLSISTPDDMEQAAIRLQQLGARHVLLKGGHLAGDPVDLLRHGDHSYRFNTPRIDSARTHGTGCTTASAIATLLAQGQPLHQAVTQAKHFITHAIETALPIGGGHGPVNHYTAAVTITDRRQPVATHKD